MPAQQVFRQPDASQSDGRAAGAWIQTGLGVGLIVSIVAHLLLLVMTAGLYLSRADGGSAPGSEVEVAIITQAELDERFEEALPEAPTPATQTAVPETVSDPLSDVVAPADALASAPADVRISGGAGADAGAGLVIEGGAGLGGASFFGVEAQGARFVYIVDVSGSMAKEKLETLQIELTDSINALSPGASFAVVFFSTGAQAVGGQVRWWEASDAAKQGAAREIRAVSARGGTNPVPAFELAFSLSPKPDAIYFMTDGLFADDAVSRIVQLNEETGGAIAPVHTISFVSRESEAIMRAIARRSGGSYTHVRGPGQ